MRRFLAPLVLVASLAAPLAAQAQARFIKVDIVTKRAHGHQGKKGENAPTTVKMRLPVSLATSALQCAQDSEIKVNGEAKKGLKTDELVKMLQSAKPGDLLLEIDTNDGDHVKITIE